MASLGKRKRVLPVLAPRPAHFYIIALDVQGRTVPTCLHRVLEELAHSVGCFGAKARLAHLDGQLILDVTRPVEALALVRFEQLLVAVRRHHHNAIVAHFLAVLNPLR